MSNPMSIEAQVAQVAQVLQAAQSTTQTDARTEGNAQLCSFLHGLPKSYASTRTQELLKYMADLASYEGNGLSTWEASNIFEGLTSGKAVKTP